jgi:hypothetical protein
MDKANAAEWILRRVMSRARASELVGDRLESRPEEGRLSFWLGIGWLVVVFSWRSVAGVLAGSIVGVVFSWAVFAYTWTHLYLLGFQVSSPLNGAYFYYLSIALLLWTASIYALVRFGFRDALTRISLLGAVLSTAAQCIFWIPYRTGVISTTALVFLLFCLISAKRRQTLATLGLALIGGGLTGYILMRIPLNPRNTGFKWLLAWELLNLLFVAAVECGIASFFHQRFEAKALSRSQLAE